MAEQPEDAINAIFRGLIDMQQLNISLADSMAVEVLLGGGPQGKRDQWGRTSKEARAEYLKFPRDRPTFERRRDHWGDFASDSQEQPETTVSQKTKPREYCTTQSKGPPAG